MIAAPGIAADISRLVREVLRDPSLEIREDSTAAEIPGWDSLANVHIILAVERHFRIRFTSREIVGLTNVGEMCTCIREKLEASCQ